jgi:NAD(P)H-dependent flavin oxidoreductase YrpB (nitropropane dioxygenase family)
MNMVGAPKHVKKALDAGVDIICAQGGEGGGHTGMCFRERGKIAVERRNREGKYS